MTKKLRPPNEREYIRILDTQGQEIRIYKGIPTIIPAGAYSLQDPITNGYHICGEAENPVWDLENQRWKTSSELW